MASRNSNVRKLKPQTALTYEEVKRLSERLAGELEYDSVRIGMITLLFQHLESQTHIVDVANEIATIKQYLFVGTGASDEAQERFQSQAYANRGKLLLWPNERSAK